MREVIIGGGLIALVVLVWTIYHQWDRIVEALEPPPFDGW